MVSKFKCGEGASRATRHSLASGNQEVSVLEGAGILGLEERERGVSAQFRGSKSPV